MTVPSPKLRRKTDNRSIADKLIIRQTVIEEADVGSLRVLDLFAGEGNLWGRLREKFHVETYTPVDMAARQAGQIRFKITPRLIAALDLSRFNVIDIDTYGDPFALWHEVLFRIKTRTVVFLTRGRVTYGAGRMPISKHAKKVMGIPIDWDVPGKVELLEYGDRSQLLEECPTAKIEFGYKTNLRRVDYYGLCVVPK